MKSNDAARQNLKTHLSVETLTPEQTADRDFSVLRLGRETQAFARVVLLAQHAHRGADAEYLRRVGDGLARVEAFARARGFA